MTDARTLLQDEYRELASFAATLSPEDWARTTECDGWTVRDVVAHVVAWDELLRLPARRWWPVRVSVHAVRLLRARGSVDRVNARLDEVWADVAPDALVVALQAAAHASTPRLFDRLAPDAQLAEVVLHHEDIRRAVDRPRSIPPERLRAALRGIRRIPGLGANAAARRAQLAAAG